MANILWIDDYAGNGTEERIGFDGQIYFVEKHGHIVKIISTREEIEDAIVSIKLYDLIIMDIIMDPLPSSSHTELQYGGIDVLEVLAAAESKIPVIILSVMSPRMIKEELTRRSLDILKIGVKETLRKGSTTPTELAKYVEKHLGNNKSHKTEKEL